MDIISKIKQYFPIKKEEFPKFILIASMMMLIVYVYSILRNSKDALVVTQMGAEAISAMKLFGVLPFAVIFMLIYTKLADVFTRIQLFHIINGFFISFFAIFALFLYPNAKAVHFDMSGAIESMPYLRHFFGMLGEWSFSLFFIFSELWGSVMLALLFWQLANQVNTVEEAKRFYPLFGFLAQAGLYMAGILGQMFSEMNLESGNWTKTLNYITISVVFAGIATSYCLWHLCMILGDETINVTKSSSGKKKIKLGFVESLKYIMSSKYIGLITALILCYGTSINLVEGVWKKSMQMQFTDSNTYGLYMGVVQEWTSICTAFFMLTGAVVLKMISWRTAALLTPIAILITGVVFFSFMVFRIELQPWIVALGYSSIAVAAFAGATQNVLSKGVKYSFFDATKEMSYIPLDDELKSKGKAAADVIGGRMGKSSGAFVQQTLLAVLVGSDLLSLSPLMFGIFLVIMVIWFFAIFALSNEFEKKKAEIA